MMRSRGIMTAALAGLSILSCTDKRATAPDNDEFPGAPMGVVASNSFQSSVRDAAAPQSNGVTYLSASPESFVDATSVRIRNRTRNGAAISADVVNGGFDPVAIPAAVGDEVTLEAITPIGSSTVEIRVPPRRPPRIVRTSPSKGRIDVALSVQIIVVFSEPVSRNSVASAIGLSSPSGVVAGHTTLADDGITATFIPDNALEPGTNYSLLINNTITDLDGDALEAGDAVTFTTMSGIPSALPGEIAFVSSRDGNQEIYRSNTDGSNVVRMTNNPGYDGEVAWSPDGNRIAFVSAPTSETYSTERHNIYIANADGSGFYQLTTTGYASHPSWSPDGKQIAFAFKNTGFPNSVGNIAVIDVAAGESSTLYLGTATVGGAQPTWLPDGTRIAFLSQPGYYDWWGRVMTIKPDGTSPETLVDASGAPRFSKIGFSPDGKQFTLNYCYGNDALIACTGGSGIAVGDYAARRLTYFPNRFPGSVWYSQWNVTWSPDGNSLAFSLRNCSGCAAMVGYSTVTGTSVGPVIDRASDPVWRPGNHQ